MSYYTILCYVILRSRESIEVRESTRVGLGDIQNKGVVRCSLGLLSLEPRQSLPSNYPPYIRTSIDSRRRVRDVSPLQDEFCVEFAVPLRAGAARDATWMIIHTYIYICIYICVCVYIYIERERARVVIVFGFCEYYDDIWEYYMRWDEMTLYCCSIWLYMVSW